MPPKTRAENIADLERLADEIGNSGAQADTNPSEMRKAMTEVSAGFRTAMLDVVAMLKGGPPEPDAAPPPAAGAPPAGGAPPAKPQAPPAKPQAPPADEEPPDDNAGYDDMALAVPDEGWVDVEGLLKTLEAEQRVTKARHTVLERQIIAMRKAQERTNAILEQLALTQIATTAPLAKGLQSLGDAMTAIPQASVVGSRPSASQVGRFGGQKPEPTGKLGALDVPTRKRTLMKALNAKAITADDIQRFNLHGAFDADPTINAEKTARVEALIAA